MKIIINADADDTDAVLHLIHQKAVHFAGPERLGWGWSWSIPNGKRFFISQIKGGFSARPTKEPRP